MSPVLRRRKTRPQLKTPDDVMTLTEHLAELRVRLIRCALAVTLFAIIIVAFYDQVLNFLIGPYERLCEAKGGGYCGAIPNESGEPQLFTLDPIEGFATRLRIASYGGIILALPIIMWQIWRFVVPALHAKEKKYAIPFILSSVLLFLLGGLIAYLTLEPALQFLIAWSGSDVGQVFQVSKYVRLVILMVAAFGVGLEFPVLLVFLQFVGVLTPQMLLGIWRYAVVAIAAIAAIITPSGDPISMAALALPMLILYFVAILIGWVAQRRRVKREAAVEIS
jgi:sec-independent protein translocase protein TatC